MNALKKYIKIAFICICLFSTSCKITTKENLNHNNKTAEQILGNPEFLAISYGGYRMTSREIQPSVEALKEDLMIMHSMGVRILRTYNLQYPHASNILKAIKELRSKHAGFEMYVMLGAWIDCANAWTDLPPNHELEDEENNASEIKKAIALANQYPEIVKIIAVGNEAMVHWATPYFVKPEVVLKWVNYLQNQKAQGHLSKAVWITSSDNFASWGGGSPDYHNQDLEQLVSAVDYISVHTYPFHDTHYNSSFWLIPEDEAALSETEIIENAMQRAKSYAVQQYQSVKNYVNSLGIEKPIHIGETGWATTSQGLYGANGSRAADEYKQALYYKLMREWTNENNIACFYFEAFDEPWKDANHPNGSENCFGLFTTDGQAKYALWPLVDKGVFKGLSRDGKFIKKTYQGNKSDLLKYIFPPKLALALKTN